jgi:hypothetical protein
VNGTLTFFIGERRFDGPHDCVSMAMAIDARLFAAHR